MDDVATVEVIELLVPGLGPVDRDKLLTQSTGIRRESGDDKAGLYRTHVDLEKRTGVVHELYDWTRLTIGGASRALWLFLMPFLLVNMVAWMQPQWPRGDDGLLRRVAGWGYSLGARLLALSLTVLVVGTVGQLALDQFAWQCAPGGRAGVCDAGNPAVKMLRSWDGSGVGAGLVIAGIAPFLVVFFLLLVARDTKQEYLPVLNTVSKETAEQAVADRVVSGKENLELEGFWEFNRRDPGTAAQHVWAGLLTTAALLTWTPLVQDADGSGGPTWVGGVLFAVIGTMALITVASVPWLYRVELKWPVDLLRRWTRRLPWLDGKLAAVGAVPLWPTRYPKIALFGCCLVNTAAILYCLVPHRNWTTGAELPGIQVQSTAVLCVQALCVCVLAVACLLLPKGGTRRRMALYGLAGPAMAVLACFVAWLYTTGFSLWAGSWLARDGRRPDLPRPVDVMGMTLPPVLLFGAVCWAVICVGVWFTHLAREGAGRSASGFPRPLRNFLAALHAQPEEADDRRHHGELRAARRRHDYLLRELDWVLGTVAVLVVLVAGSFYVRPVRTSGLQNAWDLVAKFLETVSLPLFVTLAGLMLLAFRTLAIRSEMRQNAGLAWAFGAFWPRAVHPFAPPSWTVRAVPELVHRLRVLLAPENRRVLIRANSMGGVLVLAAIWQLEPECRGRIALLTTGCPVRMYFSRSYPAFVCLSSIEALAPGRDAGLVGWTNVWRDTDPLGGPVGLPAVDVRWPDDSEQGGDPRTRGRTPEQPVFPPIDGHRGYTTDERLPALRDALLRELTREDPAQPTRSPRPEVQEVGEVQEVAEAPQTLGKPVDLEAPEAGEVPVGPKGPEASEAPADPQKAPEKPVDLEAPEAGEVPVGP
jgi:hypothetical protein